MSLENDLFATLAPVVQTQASPLKGRVYPSVLPQQFTMPAIRIQFISNVPVADLCGDGDDDTSETHVQIDGIANDFDAARTLRLSIMAAMRTFDPPALLEFDSMDFDAETKTHRTILEYSFHGSTPP